MLRKLIVWGGLSSLAIVAALVFFVTQTELGKWALGLVFVVGGSMVAMGQLYDVQTATVTSIERAAKADAFITAKVNVAYVDSSGASRSASKSIAHRPKALENLDEGDQVQVLICRSDPSIVKIPSLPSLDTKKCERPSAE